MTEEDLGKLKFRERSHIAYDDECHTLFECVSEPFANRLFVNFIKKRDKNTCDVVGNVRLHYSLDGNVYKSKEKLMEAIKDIEI